MPADAINGNANNFAESLNAAGAFWARDDKKFIRELLAPQSFSALKSIDDQKDCQARQ
jgi:predicted lipid-binding transport protein (Tim44 family)